uniref:Putative NADPH-dependent FMN reductase n=1 Tax=Streptosporangium amethystogenes TaxID=2002 RepID=M4ZR36_9ACTN|nr:putative NADPH-dependent FMN reductase [Streptosporangium amethystogenes]
MEIVDVLTILAPPRPLAGKPVVLMSASPNRFGGVFAQLQLGDMLRRVGAEVLSDFDVAVGFAHRHIDAEGVLIEEEARHDITRLWRRVLGRQHQHHRRGHQDRRPLPHPRLTLRPPAPQRRRPFRRPTTATRTWADVPRAGRQQPDSKNLGYEWPPPKAAR